MSLYEPGEEEKAKSLGALLAMLRAHGVRRFKDGVLEIEFGQDAPPKSARGLPADPSGMPTREELFNLKEQIDKPTRVGP